MGTQVGPTLRRAIMCSVNSQTQSSVLHSIIHKLCGLGEWLDLSEPQFPLMQKVINITVLGTSQGLGEGGSSLKFTGS